MMVSKVDKFSAVCMGLIGLFSILKIIVLSFK
jgi:hypothetical protein